MFPRCLFALLLVGCFVDSSPLEPSTVDTGSADAMNPDTVNLDTSVTGDATTDVSLDGDPVDSGADGSTPCVPSLEICNEQDDDCDGRTDEGVLETHFADVDEDGFGDGATMAMSCVIPSGRVTNMEDCDDADRTVNPRATEVCDEIDNNCNGEIDEGIRESRFIDGDGDGFGGERVEVCDGAVGTVDEGGDCDDTNALVNPDAPEVCNGLDDDCDGEIDGRGVGCPRGCETHRFGGHTYFLCNDRETNANARRICERVPGVTADLATITSGAENTFITTLVRSAPEEGDPWQTGVWIGLSDRGAEEEGVYRWDSGEPVGFLDWAAGEPNDGEFFDGEDCVFVINQAKAGWNDNRCGDSRRFVCETR